MRKLTRRDRGNGERQAQNALLFRCTDIEMINDTPAPDVRAFLGIRKSQFFTSTGAELASPGDDTSKKRHGCLASGGPRLPRSPRERGGECIRVRAQGKARKTAYRAMVFLDGHGSMRLRSTGPLFWKSFETQFASAQRPWIDYDRGLEPAALVTCPAENGSFGFGVDAA